MITILTKPGCKYCTLVQIELKDKCIPFVALESTADQARIIKKKYSHNTFPMVFVGNDFIGGYKEVKQMIQSGELIDNLYKKFFYTIDHTF